MRLQLATHPSTLMHSYTHMNGVTYVHGTTIYIYSYLTILIVSYCTEFMSAASRIVASFLLKYTVHD